MYQYFKTSIFHLILTSDIFRSKAMCAVCLPLLLTGLWSPTCAQRSWNFWSCYSSSLFVLFSLQFLCCLLPQQCADILVLVVLSDCQQSPVLFPPLAPWDSRLSDWYVCFVYSPHQVMLFFCQYCSLLHIIGYESTLQPFRPLNPTKMIL